MLSLSPNAAPTFPRKSVSAGTIMRSPGISKIFSFIPTRMLPVMLSPTTEINKTSSDWYKMFVSEFLETGLLEYLSDFFVFLFT